jgi:hypothetical protein
MGFMECTYRIRTPCEHSRVKTGPSLGGRGRWLYQEMRGRNRGKISTSSLSCMGRNNRRPAVNPQVWLTRGPRAFSPPGLIRRFALAGKT